MNYASIAEDVARAHGAVFPTHAHAVQLVALELARRYLVEDTTRMLSPALRQVNRLVHGGAITFQGETGIDEAPADLLAGGIDWPQVNESLVQTLDRALEGT